MKLFIIYLYMILYAIGILFSHDFTVFYWIALVTTPVVHDRRGSFRVGST